MTHIEDDAAECLALDGAIGRSVGTELIQEVRNLRAQVAALDKDAARFRWLDARALYSNTLLPGNESEWAMTFTVPFTPKSLRAAIDWRMRCDKLATDKEEGNA